ncbi:MAG: gliding motility-associated ABC transporter substrate-binding protein GldG [Bacteroidetes bacterium]|nr:gliding motility-associated ABC transporter substrate-binding protein GldG [Bacteroidota bacterium]
MKYIKANINTVLLLLIILVANLVSSFLYTRLDLTEEKRYSISKATKNFLANLDDIVTVRVFLSGNLPSGMKELEKSAEATLNEFKAYAGSRLEFEFVDLNDYPVDIQEEIGKELMEKGLNPISLTVVESGEQTQRIIFPGATLSYKGRVISANLLENKLGYDQYEILNNSITLLEYKFANAIQKLQQSHPPVIAFSTGHGEATQEQLTEIIQDLQVNQFAVSMLDLRLGYEIDKLVDVLVIAKPTQAFTEKEKYKIDQYLMRGGKIFWLIDQMAMDMDSLQGADFFMAQPRDLNLDDILFKYGVRINDDLVQDLQNTKLEIQTGFNNNQPQTQFFSWPFFPLMFGNEAHPISKNLAPISSKFVSTIDTIKNPQIKKEILLTSSAYSKALMAPVRVFVGMVQNPPPPEAYIQSQLSTAVALSGSFESVFKNRAFTGAYAQMADSTESMKFKEQSEPGARMIVVGDGDLIINASSKGKKQALGFSIYGNNNEAMVFDNKAFLLNAIEYLIDDNSLLETRSKEIKLRQLDATKVKQSKQKIQVLSLILPLVFLAIFALLYLFFRKRKYSAA